MRKVLLVTGTLIAAGAAAAVYASDELLGEWGDGIGRNGYLTGSKSAGPGGYADDAAGSRGQRHGRRARHGSEAADSLAEDDADAAGDGGPGSSGGERFAGRPRADEAARGGGRGVERRFGRMDKDGDGVVTPQEFEQAAQKRIAAASRRFFARFDANGDGKVSREEFVRASAARKQVAANEDGDEALGDDTDRPRRMRGGERMR